jgi:hypothetical protein
VFAWSLHGEYVHGVLAFFLEREHFHGGGAHLGEEAHLDPSFTHWERRTYHLEMRSNAGGG